MFNVNQKDKVMEILLILGVGSFIAYIIISTIRVWKFNKANVQILPCSQEVSSDESLFKDYDYYYHDPINRNFAGNIWNND